MRVVSNFVAWLVRLLRLFASWIERLASVQSPLPSAVAPVEQWSFTEPEPEPLPEPEPEPELVETPEVPPQDALEAAFFFAADLTGSEEVAEGPVVAPVAEPEPVPEPTPRHRRHPRAQLIQVVQTVRNIPAPAPFPAGLSGSMVGGTFTPQMAGLPIFSPGTRTASATAFERTAVLRTAGAIPFP